jgi:hypothetical protein
LYRIRYVLVPEALSLGAQQCVEQS